MKNQERLKGRREPCAWIRWRKLPDIQWFLWSVDGAAARSGFTGQRMAHSSRPSRGESGYICLLEAPGGSASRRNKHAEETKERQWKVARSLLVVVYTTETREGGRRCGRAEPECLRSHGGLHGRGTGAVLRAGEQGHAGRSTARRSGSTGTNGGEGRWFSVFGPWNGGRDERWSESRVGQGVGMVQGCSFRPCVAGRGGEFARTGRESVYVHFNQVAEMFPLASFVSK